MAELAAEIVVSANQAQREFAKASKGALQAGKSFQVMANQAEIASKRVQRSSGRASQSFFQLGQAFSDFAVAGVRGAANNLEFLAFQLGASGPLILAVTAATVAFIAFEDQIVDALTGSGAALKDLEEDVKGVADEIINLEKATKITFSGTLEELEQDSKRVGGVIGSLEEQLRKLRLELGKEQTGQTGGVTTFIASGPRAAELKEEIAAISAVLAKQKGIRDSLNDTIKEEKILQDTLAALGETTLNRKEEEVKKEKKKLSELEKQQQLNKRLLEQLRGLRNIDSSRLGTLITQNDAIKERIKLLREEARVQAVVAGFGGAVGGSVQGAGLRGGFRTGAGQRRGKEADFLDTTTQTAQEQFLDSIIPKIRVLTTTEEALAESIKDRREAQLDALASLATGADLSADAFRRAGISAEDFFFKTREGALLAAEIMSESAGTFAQAFSDAYEATGQKTKAFFNISKAFSIAQATISAYEGFNKALALGGPLGFVQAAAVLTAGLANVARIERTSPNSGRGGGSSSSGSRLSSIVDPRHGRSNSITRTNDSLGFSEFRLPLGRDATEVFGEFKLFGSDLVASFKKTSRRQNRTKGD